MLGDRRLESLIVEAVHAENVLDPVGFLHVDDGTILHDLRCCRDSSGSSSKLGRERLEVASYSWESSLQANREHSGSSG